MWTVKRMPTFEAAARVAPLSLRDMDEIESLVLASFQSGDFLGNFNGLDVRQLRWKRFAVVFEVHEPSKTIYLTAMMTWRPDLLAKISWLRIVKKIIVGLLATKKFADFARELAERYGINIDIDLFADFDVCEKSVLTPLARDIRPVELDPVGRHSVTQSNQTTGNGERSELHWAGSASFSETSAFPLNPCDKRSMKRPRTNIDWRGAAPVVTAHFGTGKSRAVMQILDGFRSNRIQALKKSSFNSRSSRYLDFRIHETKREDLISKRDLIEDRYQAVMTFRWGENVSFDVLLMEPRGLSYSVFWISSCELVDLSGFSNRVLQELVYGAYFAFAYADSDRSTPNGSKRYSTLFAHEFSNGSRVTNEMTTSDVDGIVPHGSGAHIFANYGRKERFLKNLSLDFGRWPI